MVPLFVLDDAIVAAPYGTPNRLGFLLESLTDLDASLRTRGGALVVRRGAWVDVVLQVAREARADTVHVARDVSAYAQRRLRDLERAARTAGVRVEAHDAITVVPPGALTPSSGGPFLVFTPYYKKWRQHPWRPMRTMPRTVNVPKDFDPGAIPGLADLTDGDRAPDVAPGGESEGITRLRAWSAHDLAHYADLHDDVPGDRTSRISPYLHFGCVSALEVATRLRDRPGGEAFVRQLCWRDFYAQLLAARPDTARVDVRAADPKWADDPDAVDAWKAGRTGFPLVDAGMRQLLREGWMHNRARMVVGVVLDQGPMIDWRTGAEHFMQHLVDGDVAQNQLNWQWVAGTGTDTNPHRVYNPTVQSRKFDPDAVYIRRYVDELAHIEGDIHDPPPEERERAGYPPPLVDHKEAIEHWRVARSGDEDRLGRRVALAIETAVHILREFCPRNGGELSASSRSRVGRVERWTSF